MLELIASQAAISLEQARLYGELTLANEELQGEINERRRAEEALRRSDAYLSEAQKLSHTGSFGWDVSSGKMYWSQETFRILEYEPPTESSLELILQRTHPEDRELVQQMIDRISHEINILFRSSASPKMEGAASTNSKQLFGSDGLFWNFFCTAHISHMQ
jgi:PAS domain-containing protein